MAQNYDNMAKSILSDFATEISQFVLSNNEVEVLENLDTEHQFIIGQRTDSTKRIRINNREVILHIELQLRDSTPEPMWARNAAYHGFLFSKYKIPVYSNVIYFYPTAGRNDPGFCQYSSDGYEYTLRYKVIRLIEIDGQKVLERQNPGLLPFTPLMKPPAGMEIDQWVQECVNAVSSASVDQNTQADLFCALSLFGGIVHDALLFKQRIRKALMQESKFYQLLRDEFIAEGKTQGLEEGKAQGLEQGLEQGSRDTMLNNILTLLTSKFSTDAVNELIPVLHRITDLQQLEQCFNAALQVQSLDAFKLMLDE